MRVASISLCSALLVVAAGSPSGASYLLAGSAELQLPAGTVDQAVTVTGSLQLVGRNYFLDPRFVIVDVNGAQVRVQSWLPLELPPSPPGRAGNPTLQFRTMRDFLGRRLIFTGRHRTVPLGPQGVPGALLVGSPGESYLEVQTVAEIGGTEVFRSSGSASSPADATVAQAGGGGRVAVSVSTVPSGTGGQGLVAQAATSLSPTPGTQPVVTAARASGLNPESIGAIPVAAVSAIAAPTAASGPRPVLASSAPVLTASQSAVQPVHEVQANTTRGPSPVAPVTEARSAGPAGPSPTQQEVGRGGGRDQ